VAIGTLGSIVFEVSDKKVLTFKGMTRDVSGRWTEHEVMGAKPKPEFLGPGNQKINLPITLSANLGVRPRRVLEMVEAMVESGDAEYLIINCRPVGRHPFRLTSSSETWGDMYRHGELAKANLTITLEEYT
jgi:hypothetical protein